MDAMLYGHLPAMFSPYGCCCETNSLGRGCVVIDDKNKKAAMVIAAFALQDGLEPTTP